MQSTDVGHETDESGADVNMPGAMDMPEEESQNCADGKNVCVRLELCSLGVESVDVTIRSIQVNIVRIIYFIDIVLADCLEK
jgi:hypothetical protein